jgi:hypothetical protein
MEYLFCHLTTTLTKGLVSAFAFTWYTMSDYYKNNKQKTPATTNKQQKQQEQKTPQNSLKGEN